MSCFCFQDGGSQPEAGGGAAGIFPDRNSGETHSDCPTVWMFDFPVSCAARRLRTCWNGKRRTERPFQAAWPALRTGCGFGAEVNEVSVEVQNL